MTAQPPKGLQAFQSAYSRYLKNPDVEQLPEGVPAQRSQVYETLVFNNVCGFIDKCFPVAKSLFEPPAWTRLCREFYCRWQCRTPIFSYIPKEFVDFVATKHVDISPQPWLAELLHYEWLELQVDLNKTDVAQSPTAIDIHTAVTVNPTLVCQQYQWPVHRISINDIPQQPDPTLLCVYRTPQFQVKFMAINAVTAQLLQVLREQAQTPTAALAALALQLPQFSAAQIQEFGAQTIRQLVEANVLLVAAPEPIDPSA